MNCPDTKTWNLLSMNLLDEDHAESLRRHSMECEQCHAACQNASRQHGELHEAFQAFDRNHDQRRDQLMAMLPQSTSVCETESDIVLRPTWLRGIAMTLRQHKTRWAAATLLPAACILLMFFVLTGEKVAFANVLETMRQAKTMVCDFVTTTTVVEGQLPELMTKEPLRGTISMYSDGETRAVLYAYELYGQRIRTLYVGDNAYVWDGENVRALDTSTVASKHQTAEQWLSRLLEVRESPDRNLGERTINGRRAVGFEIAGWKLGYGTRPTTGSATPADSDVQLHVWVDVEKKLPIRLETKHKMVWPDVTATIHDQWENIEWNVELDAAEFQAPAAEELAKNEPIEVPSADEKTFIEAMQAWLDSKDQAKAGIDIMRKKAEEKGDELPAVMTTMFERAKLDAGYPERLDMSWLSATFSARATLALLAKTMPAMKPVPKDMDPEDRKKLVAARAKESAMEAGTASVQAMLKATAVSAFYKKLANEEREPQYFGATVNPNDPDGILLKWKLDDGRYRVIYGDLRVATSDAA
jgi:hypothetical protein